MPDSPTSTLKTPRDRFLSLFLAYAREHDWLTAAQVVEEFPPTAIMTALESADALRARILVELAGVHEKIAPKKSVTAAGEDLQIALDEKICEPQKLLELFDCDEQVRYLPADKLWALATRDEFWKVPTDKARQRVLDVIQTALDEDLIDVNKLISSVGVDRLLADLPKELLEKSLSDAIRMGLEGKPFDYARFLFHCPLPEWTQHLALDHLWQRAVVGEILPACGLSSGAGAEGGHGGSGSSKGSGANAASRAATGAPPKNSPPPPSEPVVELPATDLEPTRSSPTSAVPPSGDRRREEVAAREKALENLRRLDRSPRDADKLSTPLLLAIDAMYVDLLQLGDDEAREECIRDAFPNEKLLEEALYAMAEALDPKLDEQELRTKVPTLESLIQLVLYEERKRTSGLASRSSSPPPGILPEGIPHSGITAGAPPLPPSRRSIPPAPLPPPARKLS